MEQEYKGTLEELATIDQELLKRQRAYFAARMMDDSAAIRETRAARAESVAKWKRWRIARLMSLPRSS